MPGGTPRPRRFAQLRSPTTVGLAVLAAATVVVAASTVGSDASTSSESRTSTARKGVVQESVSATGNLAAASAYDLDFETSGTVEKIYVEEGQEVVKGQMIARLADARQRVAVAQAEAAVDSAEEALEEAESGSGTTTGASATSRTTAIYSTAELPADSGAAIRMVVAPDATATTTEPAPAPGETTTTTKSTPSVAPTTTTPTTTKTGERSSAGKDTTTTTTPESDAKSASPTGGSASGDGSSPGSGSSSGSGSPGDSGSPSDNGSSGAGTQSVAAATAALAAAKLDLADAEEALAATRLRAPAAGTVTGINGSIGESSGGGGGGGAAGSASSSASTGSGTAGGGTGAAADATTTGSGSSSGSSSSSFVTIQSVGKLNLEVSFSEADIGSLKAGQTAAVTVTALQNVKLSATVKRVGLTAGNSSGVVSYPVTLAVTQTAKGVKPGMSASAEVVVDQARGVVVPSQALQGRTITVRKDGGDRRVAVQTGLVGDSTTLITGGLSAGTVVVLPSLSVGGTAGASGAAGRGSRSPGSAGGFSGAGGFGGAMPGGAMPSGGMPPMGGRPR